MAGEANWPIQERYATRRVFSFVEPFVPLSEINEMVFNPVSPILIENFVNSSSESFWVGVRQVLLVVEEDSRVVVLVVEWLKIFCVVRDEDSPSVVTPFYQCGIARVFAELVLCLNNIVAAFPEKSFEDSTDVFVK